MGDAERLAAIEAVAEALYAEPHADVVRQAEIAVDTLNRKATSAEQRGAHLAAAIQEYERRSGREWRS